MPGSIFDIPLKPTTGQGHLWSETLGGSFRPGTPAIARTSLSGFTDNRIPFGSSTGALEDSADLTWDGSTFLASSTLDGSISLRSGNASSGVSADARLVAANDASRLGLMIVGSTGNTSTFFTGVTRANSMFLGSGSALDALAIGFIGQAKPIVFGTNSTEYARLVGTGQWLFGDTASRTYGAVAPAVQVSAASAAGAALSIFRHSAGGNAPRLIMGTSRGAAGTATAVQSGDVLFQFDAAGADGTDTGTVGAQQIAIVDAAVAGDIVPTAWRWDTMNSAGAVGTRLTISSAGIVSITNSTATTLPTNGCLVTTGGIGCGGSLSCAIGFTALRAGSDTGGAGPFALVGDATNSNSWLWQLSASNYLDLYSYAASTMTRRMRIDATSTAGNTCLMLYDVDNATVERVTVGAADSGGVGYKVLRIPN